MQRHKAQLQTDYWWRSPSVCERDLNTATVAGCNAHIYPNGTATVWHDWGKETQFLQNWKHLCLNEEDEWDLQSKPQVVW